MGDGSRTQKTQSLFSSAKGDFKVLLLIPFFCFLISSCASSSPEQKTKEKVQQTFKKSLNFRPLGEIVVPAGENSDASWSPDSQKILFISANRTAHKNSQIYEFDFTSREERRITFSDGDASNPKYLPDGEKFLYASTTDELKERPLLLRKKESPDLFPPSDLYLGYLTGLEIVRLTQRPGFDGQIRIKPGSPLEFYYTSLMQNIRQVYKFNLLNKSSQAVFSDQNDDRRDFTALNNHFAWVVTQADSSPVQRLVIGDGSLSKVKKLDFGEAVFKDLQWVDFGSGDQKLFLTASFRDRPNSQIYYYDLGKNCIVPVLQHDKAELSQAEVSPDRKKMIFTSNEIEARRQIFVKNLDLSNNAACLFNPR